MKSDSLSWKNKKDIDFLVEVLKQENVVAGSSDTVLGFLAPLTNSGFEKLNFLKGRQKKPYLLLIGSKEKCSNFSDCCKNPDVKKIIDAFWPGPITMILKAKKSLPQFITSSSQAIALRMPLHKGLLNLLQHFDGLFSTSINKTGQPVCQKFSDIDEHVLKNVLHLIGENSDPKFVYPSTASTIIDCTASQLKVVREGAITCAEIERECGVPVVKR
ncbi:L-threonylcarbamoyladenylate synthase [bacterium]|jgi:L-threonylcarbamoyladenylate synthase|nr:L-threonylcarbamoyladenylate synthase [bacterium]